MFCKMAEEVVPELYELLVKEEATVERTREVRMGGVSKWYTWAQPGCKSMAELTEGEAMMESWLMTSRHRWRAERVPSDTDGSGDQGVAAATNVQGGARVPED